MKVSQSAESATPEQESEPGVAYPVDRQPRDAELLGWLAGALEPGEARRLAGELAASPRLQLRLAELRARVEESAEETGPELRIPPAGVRGSRIPLYAQVESTPLFASSAAGSAQAASEPTATRIRLRPPDGQRRTLILLHRVEGRWRVLEPSEPDATVALQDLEPVGEDYALELAPPPGPQRYAVALPLPGQADPDWGLDEPERWKSLREAINRGEVPLFSLELGAPDPAAPPTKTGA